MAAHLGPRFRVLGSRAAYVKHELDVQEGQLRAGATPGDAVFGEEPEAVWGVLGNASDGFEPVPTRRGDYPAFYAGVAAAVRGGSDPPVPVQDTLTVLEVIDAARLSARTGDTVRI
jgi:scyllo-inositol 2-dehydrogenase (NADP+)